MYALIDPTTNRVCELQEHTFPVADPFFWLACSSDVNADTHYYDGTTIAIKPVPTAAVDPIDSIYAQYKVANQHSIATLLSTSYPDLFIKTQTNNNGDVIGIWVTGVRTEGNAPSTMGALSARRFANDAKRLGVPAFQNIAPVSGTTVAELTSFWELLGYAHTTIDDVVFSYTPWSLELAKNRKARLIEQDRDKVVSDGVSWNGHLWDCSDVSRANLTGVVASVNAGVALPSGFVWRSKDNQNVALSEAEVVELAAAMLAHVNQAYQQSWQRKEIVAAATTEEEVNAA